MVFTNSGSCFHGEDLKGVKYILEHDLSLGLETGIKVFKSFSMLSIPVVPLVTLTLKQ
jgi:hypothetical protein